MTVKERVTRFLAERPTYQFSRAGIARGTGIARGALMVPLRGLVLDGAIRRCNPDRGPAMYQSLDKPPTLTPSEVALARVAAAYAAWPASDDPADPMWSIGEDLARAGLWQGTGATPAGTDLLDRARRAGVL